MCRTKTSSNRGVYALYNQMKITSFDDKRVSIQILKHSCVHPVQSLVVCKRNQIPLAPSRHFTP